MPNVLIVNSALALTLAGLDPLQGNDPYNRIEPVRLSTADEWAVPYSLLADLNQPAYKRALVAGAEVRNITQADLFSPASDARNFAKFRIYWRGHSYFPQFDMTKPCYHIDPAAGMITLFGHKTFIGRAADTDGGVDRSRTEISHDVELPRGVDLWTSFWFRQVPLFGDHLMTEMSIWQVHQVDDPDDHENLSPPVMVRQQFRERDEQVSWEWLYRGSTQNPMVDEAPTNFALQDTTYTPGPWRHLLIRLNQNNAGAGEWQAWVNGVEIFDLSGISNHFTTTSKLDYDKQGYYSSPASTTFLMVQFYDLNPTSTTSLAHLIGNPGPPPSDALPTELITKVQPYALAFAA